MYTYYRCSSKLWKNFFYRANHDYKRCWIRMLVKVKPLLPESPWMYWCRVLQMKHYLINKMLKVEKHQIQRIFALVVFDYHYFLEWRHHHICSLVGHSHTPLFVPLQYSCIHPDMQGYLNDKIKEERDIKLELSTVEWHKCLGYILTKEAETSKLASVQISK